MRQPHLQIFATLLILSVTACGGDKRNASSDGFTAITGSVTPTEVTAFGHELVTVTLDEPLFANDEPTITIDGNAVYDIEKVDARTIRFRWQGLREGSSADIEFVGKRRVRLQKALQVTRPAHPAFMRMVSIGASFGQGVQSVGFDQDTAMFAPSAQIARQAGAYFPLPLTKRGHIPFIEPTDFADGSPGDDPCEPGDLVDKEIASLERALAGFRGLEGRLAPNAIRIDANIKVQNAAVGGEVLGGVVEGAEAVGMPILTLLEHLVYDPVSTWEDMLRAPEVGSQVDYALTLEPTLWMSVDIGGNDVLPALGSFNASRIPEDAYWHKHYKTLFSKIDAESYLFIADLPDITLLPNERKQRADKIANGETTAAVDAKLEAIRTRLDEVNAILAEEAKPYPNVTIVPFTKLVDDLYATGATVAGQALSFDNFGGFISLDGLHLSRTGYGFIANLFIESMNAKLGTEIPDVDLAALVETDPYSPANLAPYGLSVTACPTP